LVEFNQQPLQVSRWQTNYPTPQINQGKLKDFNMYEVALGNTRISTDYAQRSMIKPIPSSKEMFREFNISYTCLSLSH